MKASVIRFILLGVFLSGSYLSCLYLLTDSRYESELRNLETFTGGYGYSLKRFREINQYNNIDLLFVGSSHAYRGFDTRVFKQYGYSSFNMGTSSQPPLCTYFLLKEYIDSLKPNTVILEANWVLFSMEHGTESAIDIISNTRFSRHKLNMALATKDVMTVNSMLGAYLHRLDIPLKKAHQRNFEHDQYISGGYVATKAADTSIARLVEGKDIDNDLRLHSRQLNFYKKIIQFLKKRGIELIVVRAPVARPLFRKIENYGALTRPIAEIADNNNVPFIDFNKEAVYKAMNLKTESDFYDGYHLSYSGVRKFNRYLIENYAYLWNRGEIRQKRKSDF